MGTKRSWEGELVASQTADGADDSMASTQSVSPTISIFESFRNELDEHHDRRERIIKVSRDITALSKKIIFALQRVRVTNHPLPPNIAKENQSRFNQIHNLFTSIISDVTGINAWRYQRQISSGIQEFIEAISFDHYLRTQTLISHEEVAARLPSELLVTEEDYLMGLFDLTGEMMRFAVMALSSGNAVPADQSLQMDTTEDNATSLPNLSDTQAAIVVDLQAMRAHFEALSLSRKYGMMRDLQKKIDTMQNSVEKVERAAYGILVRGSERPSGWMPDLSGPLELEGH